MDSEDPEFPPAPPMVLPGPRPVAEDLFPAPENLPQIPNAQTHPTIRLSGTATASATIFRNLEPQPPQQPQPNVNNNNLNEAPNNNNNPTNNLFHMRDRLFLALFFRVSLLYARTVPKTVRRLFEFCLLMQSLVLLLTLGYIHIVFTQRPITCLADYKDAWSKDGILRVEITSEPPGEYSIAKSYEKEERLRQRHVIGHTYDEIIASALFLETSSILDKAMSTAVSIVKSFGYATEDDNGDKTEVVVDPEPEPEPGISTAEETYHQILKPSEPINSILEDQDAYESSTSAIDNENEQDPPEENDPEEIEDVAHEETEEDESNAAEGLEEIGIIAESNDKLNRTGHGKYSEFYNKTLEQIEIMKIHRRHIEEEAVLKSSISDFEMFANSVWSQDTAYIVEYALEFGFLRLSPETRQRLNIPVKIITLDPSKETCFGDNFSRFLLDHFLGYEDILMSSIKNLAENEENKGYLRNVITGDHYRFVPMWMTRTAYIPAFIIMIVFTVSISMLLRYSHHQIFVFIVDLLNNIEGNTLSVHIPAAPLFTVILALVGMEAIMSEFFNDTSTAFYVILIVWIADQYDSVCSHTPLTRKYWVRFFYLYHFSFYAYHYRFNGQYGGLALLTSWSFIQHSMVYFYHHYELPTILRQAAHQPDGTTRSRSTSPNPPSTRQQEASTQFPNTNAHNVPSTGTAPVSVPSSTSISPNPNSTSTSFNINAVISAQVTFSSPSGRQTANPYNGSPISLVGLTDDHSGLRLRSRGDGPSAEADTPSSRMAEVD